MQNRKVIILSLGMLLEKVDTSGFIAKLLRKAKEENAAFIFTPELQKQGFLLSEDFNQGKIDSGAFETKLLQLLGIKTMSSDEFWSEWNNMLTVGAIAEKIKLLQEMISRHNALIYLSSDTNGAHFAAIEREAAKQGVTLTMTTQPVLSVLLEQFPLYASFQVKKNHQELMKHIVDDIRAKEFNKPDTITLILGNPANVKDTTNRAVVQRQCDAITAWCGENNVSVQLHNQSLEETVTKIFIPESTEANTLKPAFC